MHMLLNSASAGSSVASVRPARSPLSGQQDSRPQQVKPSPPIHLPLQQLDSRHLALHLPVAPVRRNRTQHCGGILLDTTGKVEISRFCGSSVIPVQASGGEQNPLPKKFK